MWFLLLCSLAFADDTVVTLDEGDPAPFAGTLLSPEAAAKIIVSSDDQKIISLKSKYKKIYFVKRPPKLCKDSSKAIESVLYHLKCEKNNNFDTVSLLLPTCPFRDHYDIRNAYKKLNKNLTSVISVKKYGFPINFAIKHTRLFSKPFFKNSAYVTGNTSTQNKTPLFHPNGGIYLAWVKKILKYKSFFKNKFQIYIMDDMKSVDIDNKFDFLLAKQIYKLLGNK